MICEFIDEAFNEEGILDITDKLKAHSILQGTVKKVHEGPYTYNKTESVSEYRLSLIHI